MQSKKKPRFALTTTVRAVREKRGRKEKKREQNCGRGKRKGKHSGPLHQRKEGGERGSKNFKGGEKRGSVA